VAISTGKLTAKTTQQVVKASSGASQSIRLKAAEGNEKLIWVGGKTETEAEKAGYPLAKGESIPVDTSDVGLLYFTGEKEGDILYYIMTGNAS
jgi:hypothetical protein